MAIQLAPPSNWQDFESLTLVLWKSIWNDFNAQKNGRQGQSQSGIDVFGQPQGTRIWEGIQCKGKQNFQHKIITPEELDREFKKAKKFRPRISSFIMATTAPRDVNIQEEARKKCSFKSLPSRISVWSWNDIEDELNFRDYLLPTLYPRMFNPSTYRAGSLTNKGTIYLYRAQPIDQITSIFERPQFSHLFTPEFRIDLKNFIFEIALNAFEHGSATKVGIKISTNNSILIEEDGSEFDTLSQIEVNNKSSAHVGLLYISEFIKKYDKLLVCKYRRKGNNNLIQINLIDQGKKLSQPISEYIFLADNDAIYPSKAIFLARSAIIPKGYDIIKLEISSVMFSGSSFYEFLRALIPRLTKDSKLQITCKTNSIISRCIKAWNDDNLFNDRLILDEK